MFRETLLRVLPILVVSVSGLEYFSRLPAKDYFWRTTSSDCIDRFYPPKPDVILGNREEPAVHNGFRAFNGEYQHMAAIGWLIDDKTKYFCGGTLISSRHVLTAAHCAVAIDGGEPNTVRLGDTDLGSSQYDFSAQQIGIKRITRHPLHRLTRSYHDIAVIELEQEAKFNEDICPACLWLESYIPSETMRIVGFGATGFSEELSSTLQQGRVDHLSSDSCNEIFVSNRKSPDGLIDSQFCASHASMDTCQGDSGGPIEVQRVDLFDFVHPLVVGVTSFGTPCVNGSTGVYTRIAPYLDWIQNATGETYSYMKCTTQCQMRMYGGNSVVPTSFRGVVHLLTGRSIENRFNCSGTLIDDRFVLTAASCVTSAEGSPKFIYISDNKEVVQVDDIYIHPKYKNDEATNDIALLKLTQYLKSNSTLKPACISQDTTNKLESYSFIMNTQNRKSPSEIEFKYYSKWVRHDECGEHLRPNELCVNNIFPVIPNFCNLEHGGPILDGHSSAIPTIYGIVSKRSTGCDQKMYGTLVGPHTQWIDSVVFRMHRGDTFVFA